MLRNLCIIEVVVNGHQTVTAGKHDVGVQAKCKDIGKSCAHLISDEQPIRGQNHEKFSYLIKVSFEMSPLALDDGPATFCLPLIDDFVKDIR